MYKIVLTGGPCAGKTSALRGIRDYFVKNGYQVFIVPETATPLFMAGLSPELVGNQKFQKAIIDIQTKIEEVFHEVAEYMSNIQDTIVIFDRGLADGAAFCTSEEWSGILEACKHNEESIFGRYDCVIHLESVATTMPELYSNATNEIRREDAKSAAENDELIKNSWRGHPGFCVVGNYPTFETKMKTIIRAIEFLMGP